MDDCTSREAAIAYIRERAEEMQKAFEELGGESGIYADAYNDLAEDFYRIPAADVEPVRHGNWNIRLADELTLCLECSVCGRRVDNIDLHHLLEAGEYGEACRKYPYCHCGARMVLEPVEEMRAVWASGGERDAPEEILQVRGIWGYGKRSYGLGQELARLHDDLGHRGLDGAECDGAGPGGPEERGKPHRGADGLI